MLRHGFSPNSVATTRRRTKAVHRMAFCVQYDANSQQNRGITQCL